MPLTSADETDLILPLFDATGERPPFATFLDRLQRRTRAHHLNVVVRVGGHINEWFVGPDMRDRARGLDDQEFALLDKINYDRLRPGRVYSAEEFLQADPVLSSRRGEYMRALGVADERVVRVLADAEASAWLIMSRTSPCSAEDSALLSNLAPYVGRTVRTMLALDRQRLAAGLSIDGLGRAGAGWIAFDNAARVIAVADSASGLLARFGVTVRAGTRLTALSPPGDQELVEAAAAFADGGDIRPRSLILREAPRIEALLVPAQTAEVCVMTAPAMVALLRWPREPSPARAEQLAAMFGLARREAELAWALADGLSLNEAAEQLGLTIETTRNYSKRLYAKLGVRRQAEVVRLVSESAAALA
jgi:DNA-binding CsgD family transcriptional regulator